MTRPAARAREGSPAGARVLALLRGERPDRGADVGARAHYDDPPYYTSTYRARVADVAYYVDQAVRSGGPVLELGVGNGRVALPTARHGVSVVGVDRSGPMLADLRARLRSEPPDVRARLSLKPGDMRRVRLGRRFPLVVAPFNTALHLFSRRDLEQFFAVVCAHLAPGGTFVVDLSTPQPLDLARDPSELHGAPPFRHPTAGLVRYKERFDYDRVRQILHVTMHFEPKDGSSPWTVPLAHRQLFPAEFEALLHYNGLEAFDVHGDFAGGPLTEASDVMIWHARKRRR